VLPPNVPGDPEALFSITQLPTGDVIDVKVLKSSGHKVLDEAIERAIRKSSPLPRPDKPEQFEREIRMTYRLRDLKTGG
jgi:colicin import membrane protein